MAFQDPLLWKDSSLQIFEVAEPSNILDFVLLKVEAGRKEPKFLHTLPNHVYNG